MAELSRYLAFDHHSSSDVVEIQYEGMRITHSGKPPFIARSAANNTDDWPYWYVRTKDSNLNGLHVYGPYTGMGLKFVDRASAREIADLLNKAAASG